MKTNSLIKDILTKGAILGCVMLISHIAELMMLLYGGSLMWFGIMFIEWIAVATLFIYLLYRYTRHYTGLVYRMQIKQGRVPQFSYLNGLCYIVAVSTLAGVIIGIGDYVFHNAIIGHEVYIKRSMEIMVNLLNGLGVSPDAPAVHEQITEFNKTIQELPNPSLFETVYNSMFNYMIISGLMLGSIIAIFTKRSPKDEFSNPENNNE